MAFSFKHNSRVAHQVRAIAVSQAEKALELARSGDDFDATVHALRRRCKKLRGLLRLVKPHFDEFAEENAALRRAAGLFGSARDARVLVETFDSLPQSAEARAVRELLESRARELAHSDSHDRELADFIAIFDALAERAADWQFDEQGFELVGDGLEKTYRQFVNGLSAAIEDPMAEPMHEWRKAAKYHLFHMSLLIRAAPDVLGAHTQLLDQLGDHLGDHHNFAVLADTLVSESAHVGDIAATRQAIETRQHELAGKAFVLGRQLAAEKPGALRRRVARYWDLFPGEA